MHPHTWNLLVGTWIYSIHLEVEEIRLNIWMENNNMTNFWEGIHFSIHSIIPPDGNGFLNFCKVLKT